MPHSRTDIELDDEVLRSLPAAHYKILRYLVNRADARGVCYPGNERIAEGVHYHERHIESLLPELAETGLIAYLRRGAYDELTRRRLPNVLMVNPAYICIAEAHQAEAKRLWDSTGVSIRFHPNHSTPLTNNKNQPQLPTPKGEPAPRTNNNTASKAKRPKPREVQNDPTATQENDTTQDTQPARERTAEHKNPSVPPRAPFVNPAAIDYALPDNQHEALAMKLRGLKIPMGMARGFVAEYGVKKCEDALLQTLAAQKEGGVDRPGGFFRAILQGNYTDAESLTQTDDKWDWLKEI